MPDSAIAELEAKCRRYVIAFRMAVVAFVLNTAVSGIVCIVNHPLPGLTTKTTFVTSVIYVVVKLASVFMTTNADPGEFHSGYVSTRLQFNDVDRNLWTNNIHVSHVTPGMAVDMSVAVHQVEMKGIGMQHMNSKSSSGSGSGSGSGSDNGSSYGAITASADDGADIEDPTLYARGPYC